MKWGILSYGTIVPKFLESLSACPSESLVAIASGSNFAKAKEDYPNVNVYKSYNDLFLDPEVEIIYLASTNNFHYDLAVRALEAGKHVLCEKPMTTSSIDTKKLIQLAKKKNLFLMEAIWTRSLPAYRQILDLISDGIIGEVKYLSATFSIFNDWGYDRRLYNKELAGGATYDVGIYNISLATDIFGCYPTNIKATGVIGVTGVDESSIAILEYKDGKYANLHCGFRFPTDHVAKIYGSKGNIEMDLHWKVQNFKINIEGEDPRTYNIPFTSNGYAHEIMEASKCISENRLESYTVPHQSSIAIAEIIDVIHEKISY